MNALPAGPGNRIAGYRAVVVSTRPGTPCSDATPAGRLSRAAGGLLSVALILCGCRVLPEPGEDPTRFYTLSAQDVASESPPPEAWTLGIEEIDIAEYLRTRAMAVREGETSIAFREFHRWAEPLEDGIGRVVAEDIRALAGVHVATAPFAGARTRELTLLLRILACEGRALPGGSPSIRFVADWELISHARRGEEVIARRRFVSDGAVPWDGADHAQLAAALSKAVGELGVEIAGIVCDTSGGPRAAAR